MILSGRLLKEKLDYMLHDQSVTKEDLIDILLMSIEEGLSAQQAISDIFIEGFEELIDLETILDSSDRANGCHVIENVDLSCIGNQKEVQLKILININHQSTGKPCELYCV
jgi:hypothetical protein